ncbi:tetratricopeptide repeat protein [Nonlabens ulvanivorans]|uniref:Tetratricopeptide repeat protein n=1 Tax=Nonlabens ulvanivorans TaxID=906888 RepID=A0A081DBN4_NONUL|nr:tetratricopeptide repeat protein [Nonlabens ulvanivorans]GAK76330.1 hypothetical protein JCM19296_1927 [Nonlabens ulvanivorans]
MVDKYSRINELLNKPHEMMVDDLSILENTIKKFPWFQAARSVHLKGLHNESSPLYNKELQITATHTADRGVLFDFITSPIFVQNRISQQIKNQQDYLKEIPVDIESIHIKEEDFNSSVDFKNTLDKDLFERPTNTTSIVDEPLKFNQSESYSFAEWLKLTSLKPINRKIEVTNKSPNDDTETAPVVDAEKAKKMAIIDQFLAEKPKIKPRKDKVSSTNIADLQTPSDQLMTETLAQVYLAQNNYPKAIQAYQVLVLQHPEKSGFFADRIREIKNLQSNI